jgi:hypothetical protein
MTRKQREAFRDAYRIQLNPNEDKNVKVVRQVLATSYKHAANIAARKMYGARTSTYRVYGFEDFSGYFQAYINVQDNNGLYMRLYGKPFYVEIDLSRRKQYFGDNNNGRKANNEDNR